jgi:hypothetical protein
MTDGTVHVPVGDIFDIFDKTTTWEMLTVAAAAPVAVAALWGLLLARPAHGYSASVESIEAQPVLSYVHNTSRFFQVALPDLTHTHTHTHSLS